MAGMIKVTELSLEDIKGCYDPAKAGFDIDAYLALEKKEQEKVYWKQSDIFFDTSFNEGTLESHLRELKYDKRYKEDSQILLFTDGSFHSIYGDESSQIFQEIPEVIKATRKMWFWHNLDGYGYEHYVDGIMGFGGPYNTRIDLKPEERL